MTAFCNALNAYASVIYDERGLFLRMTDLNNYTTVNSQGDLISVADPEEAVTSVHHDDLGRIISKTKPLGNR
ncbi:RHS repeat protein [Desulfobulbus sp. TB]|nr:RHS repeat protein [Desulfobulbus sp. TB]